jgi:hypothetical protein
MEILSQNSQNGDGQTCDCSEGKHEDSDGRIVSNGLHVHSCLYVKQRTALISVAELYANARVLPEDRGKKLWSRIFHRRIDELMREKQNGGGDR